MVLLPEEIRARIRRTRTVLTSGWVSILDPPTSGNIYHIQLVRGDIREVIFSGVIQIGTLASGQTSGSAETVLDDVLIDTAQNKGFFELGPGEDSEVPYVNLELGEALRANAGGAISGSSITVVWWPEYQW